MKYIKEIKLPFGIKEGLIVQISEVERGIKCKCFCPACGHPLVARKGTKVIHHFAHYQRAECKKALETSLHIAAKKVIEEMGFILLPAVENDILYIKAGELAPETKFYFDKIFLEKGFNDFVPDIILEKNGRKLCVEIFVTHKIDETKKKKIEKSDISTIEINLSKIEKKIDFEFLKLHIVDSTENRVWIYNAKKEKLRNQIFKVSLKKKIISRGFAQHVDGCPLPARVWNGKPYANFIDDCLGCKYLVTPRDLETNDYIFCIGHKKDDEIKNLLCF